MENSSAEEPRDRPPRFPEAAFDIVALAASAGGLNALAQVLCHGSRRLDERQIKKLQRRLSRSRESGRERGSPADSSQSGTATRATGLINALK